VQLELHSDVSADGHSPFWLGALLVPPEGAHLYWINPGETGLGTTAEFQVPRGYRVSEVQYPGPVSFRSDRGAVGYGYTGKVALLARVTPDAPEAEDRFFVRASWLSCDDLCVEESGEAELRLGAATQTVSLAPFVERLPATEHDIVVRRLAAREVVLESADGITLLEYFPYARLGLDERAPASNRAEGRLLVTLGNDAPLHGVVRAAEHERIKYFEVREASSSVDGAQAEFE
jgi:hypothetical protein